MSRTRKNPVNAYEDLVAQHERGKAQPAPHPTHLPLDKVKVHAEVFQHRRPAEFLSKRHIREMADAAKHRDLDPLTVWWDGKHYSLIDGHHRRMAYITAQKGKSHVPVEVFEGTPQQALARAASANTKDKLPMSESEKQNAAWRLVVMAEGMSKAKQAEASGVSERSVANMRKVKATLTKQGTSLSSLADMGWHAARKGAAGADDDYSPDEEQARIEKMALALRKALGDTADRQPEVFWRAVEVFSPQLARGLADFIGMDPSEDEQDPDGEPEGEPAVHP